MTLPCFITMIRSAKAASSIKCVIYTIVMPSSLLRRYTVSITSLRPLGSSIAVGSSNMIHFGFIAKTPAMAIRCFCPPDNR